MGGGGGVGGETTRMSGPTDEDHLLYSSDFRFSVHPRQFVLS